MRRDEPLCDHDWSKGSMPDPHRQTIASAGLMHREQAAPSLMPVHPTRWTLTPSADVAASTGPSSHCSKRTALTKCIAAAFVEVPTVLPDEGVHLWSARRTRQ